MEKNSGEGFLLGAKYYKNSNNAALLVSNKWHPEGKADVKWEGMVVKKQEKTTTKQQATQKIHANNIHMKIGHPI